MNNNEKLLLIELILRDIRGNWGWDNGKRRDYFVRDLCEELKDEVKDIGILKERVELYIKTDDKDGRFFRRFFPNGYDFMDRLHGLKFTIKDKSDDFIKNAIEYITYPDNVFYDIPDEEEWHEFKELFKEREVQG